MIQGSRLDSLRHRIRRGQQLGDLEPGEDSLPSVQNADMRSIELVRGAGQEVALDMAHVYRLVGSEMHGVDEGQRSCIPGQGGCAGDIIHGAERVGRAPDGKQSWTARHESFQARPVELPGFRKDRYRSNGNPAIALQGSPRCNVGVMVELGHHDRIAWPPGPSQCAGQVKGESRHIGPKRDLGGVRTKEIRQRFAVRQDERVRLLARGIGPIGVGIMLVQIRFHGGHDIPGYLGAARPIEVRYGNTSVPSLQSREGSSDFRDGPGCQRGSSDCAHAVPVMEAAYTLWRLSRPQRTFNAYYPPPCSDLLSTIFLPGAYDGVALPESVCRVHRIAVCPGRARRVRRGRYRAQRAGEHHS